MIFEKENIPFFNELKKTNRVILKDNEKYCLYEASTQELAKKVDALMDNNGLGFDIDDYIVNKNINIQEVLWQNILM